MKIITLILGLIIFINLIDNVSSVYGSSDLILEDTNSNNSHIINNSSYNFNSSYIFKDCKKDYKNLDVAFNELDNYLKLQFSLSNNTNCSNLNKSKNNLFNNISINKSVINPNKNLTVNNSSNIHHNTTNLVNLNTDKNKQCKVLFNDTLHNKNQYNKSCKLLGLNHSVNNDSIFNDKELNISKSNSNMCDDSSEDNFLINPVPESDNKDYNIMFLILPVLLLLLGAIILYKIKK